MNICDSTKLWHSAGSGDRSNANALTQIFSTHRVGLCYNVTIQQERVSHASVGLSQPALCLRTSDISWKGSVRPEVSSAKELKSKKGFHFPECNQANIVFFAQHQNLANFLRQLSDADIGPAPPCGGLLEQSPRAVQVYWTLCLHRWVHCQLGF